MSEHIETEPAAAAPPTPPDPLHNAAAVVDALALLRLIADPAESKARLDALREAKRAADDQLVAVGCREQALARREGLVAEKIRQVDAREVAVSRRAAEIDQRSADLDEYSTRLKRAKNDLGIRSAQVELIVERLGPRFGALLTPVEIPEEVPSGSGRSLGSQRTQFRKADSAGATA